MSVSKSSKSPASSGSSRSSMDPVTPPSTDESKSPSTTVRTYQAFNPSIRINRPRRTAYLVWQDPFDASTWAKASSVCLVPLTPGKKQKSIVKQVLKRGPDHTYSVYSIDAEDVLSYFPTLGLVRAPDLSVDDIKGMTWVIKEYRITQDDHEEALAYTAVRAQQLASMLSSEVASFRMPTNLKDRNRPLKDVSLQMCCNILPVYYAWRCLDEKGAGTQFMAMPAASMTMDDYIYDSLTAQMFDTRRPAAAAERTLWLSHMVCLVHQATAAIAAVHSAPLQVCHHDFHGGNAFITMPSHPRYQHHMHQYELVEYENGAGSSTFVRLPMKAQNTPWLQMADFDQAYSDRFQHLRPRGDPTPLGDPSFYTDKTKVQHMEWWHDQVHFASSVRHVCRQRLAELQLRGQVFDELAQLDRLLGEMAGGFDYCSFTGFVLQRITVGLPGSGLDWVRRPPMNLKNVNALTPQTFLATSLSLRFRKFIVDAAERKDELDTNEHPPIPLYTATDTKLGDFTGLDPDDKEFLDSPDDLLAPSRHFREQVT